MRGEKPPIIFNLQQWLGEVTERFELSTPLIILVGEEIN
jgi:hypothetical protein